MSHRDPEPALLVVDLLDHAVEVVERPVDDPHDLAGLEQHLRPRLLRALAYPVEDLVHLARGDRHRLTGRSGDESEDVVHPLDEMPRLVRHLHFHQHVAGEELALAPALLGRSAFPPPPRWEPGSCRTGRAAMPAREIRSSSSLLTRFSNPE